MDRVIPTSPEEEDAALSDDGREPVERMADEFLARVRRGERPRVEEYVALMPDRAEEIRDLFSALIMVEDLKPQTGDLTIRPGGGGPDLRSRQPLDRLGDYRILREIGRGGMGIVYEAEQESLGRRVALKVLAPWTRPGPSYLLRFQREARSAARLHHTNIVPIFGVGEHQGLHYYAMQFIQGIGLDQVLREVVRLRRIDRAEVVPADEPREGSSGDTSTNASATLVAVSLVTGRFAPPSSYSPGPSPRPEPRPGPDPAPDPGARPGSARIPRADDHARSPAPAASSVMLPGHSDLSSATDSVGQYARSVARIGVQVAEALEYAHQQGMVHRDVKPSNLLLDCHGNVWVTDFGLVKAVDDDDLTHTGDLVGTLRYMAPERFSGQCTPLSDVYSLGLTLYELLVLRPAFDAPDRNCLIHQISQELPPALRKQDPAVPRDLETIIHKAIEKSSQDRYATAGHLAEDLKRWLVHEPIRARPSGPGERLVKWARRNPSPALFAGVSVLTLVALMASLLVGYVQVHRGLHRERRASYFQRVALAERAWSSNDVGRAEELLDACDREFRGWEWHYLKRLCHSDLTTVRAHAGLEPNAAALSPDGTLLAMSGEDGKVTIRDASTGHILATVAGHPGKAPERGVYDIAFSPDGRRLATAGGDRMVRLWDVATGRPLDIPPLLHSAAVLGVAFSPDGERIAAASGSFWGPSTGSDSNAGELVIWDATTGELENCLEGHVGTVHEAVFSPDGTQLASAGADGTVQLWDVETGSPLRTLRGHTYGVTGVAFGPGGRLVSAGLDGTLRVWDAADGRPLMTLREPDERFYAIAVSGDGKRLAAAGRSWAVTLWDAGTGAKIDTYRGHAREVTGVMFGPGDRMISVGYDGLVKFWDTTRGQEARTARGEAGALVAVAFSPEARRLATAGLDGPVRILDTATGSAAVDLGEGPGPHRGVAFSPDGKALVAAWSPAGTVTIRDAATGRERHSIPAHRGEVTAVACSPDSTRLATGGADGTVTIRDLATGGQLARYVIGPLPVTALAFSPDGQNLAASTGNRESISVPGLVMIRNVQTGREVRVLRGHSAGVSDLAYSPDGSRLATASWDRTVGVWNLSTGALEHTFGIRGLIIWAVAFHPDGRRLVAADNVGRMTFWELESGLEVLTLRGHSDRIYDLAFSKDGRLLASASRDATAKIWDATPLLER